MRARSPQEFAYITISGTITIGVFKNLRCDTLACWDLVGNIPPRGEDATKHDRDKLTEEEKLNATLQV